MNEQIKNSISAFVQTLRKMFMIDDAAELDFGIYRIMAQKKAEIEAFFGLNDVSDENALCRKIEKLLAEQQGASVNVNDIKKQLEDRIRMYKEDGDTMEQINKKPRIVELRRQLEDCGDPSVMLPHVLTALNDFFARYYDNGDFISQRRYANGDDATYLVPYNGEEVKLYWANYDQYYIKTSEAFKNYRFKLSNGKEVEFTLKNAAQLKNNEKDLKDWTRKFKLWNGVSESEEEPTPDFVPVQLEEDGILHIYFTYELMPKKGNDQKSLNKATFETLAAIIGNKYADDYMGLLQIPAESKIEELNRHINRYTSKNSSDYFIHKNLGDFLRRELDYFLKNEVLHVSDLDYNNLRRTLAEAKTIKAIGEEIIQMLAGIEDFQKKLWLKKKFVVQSDYCITLDRVPESLYEEVCANEDQHEEWKHLFDIQSIQATDGDMFTSGKQGYTGKLTVQFLKENQHLVLDTAFFSADFKQRLLSSIENIDAKCDGLLINSENFQAMELLQEKYQEKVKCVYIDPPYNTGGDGFVYKDNFQDSSWLSLMHDRLDLAKRLQKEDGSIFVSIDDKEQANLKLLLEQIYKNFIGQVMWHKNYASANDSKTFSSVLDHILVYRKTEAFLRNLLPRTDKQNSLYKYDSNDGKGLWRPDNLSVRTYSEGYDYPIVNPNTGISYNPPKGRCWMTNEEKVQQWIKETRIFFGQDGNGAPQLKRYLSEVQQGVVPTTYWSYDDCGHNDEARKELKDYFLDPPFDSPKPTRLIKQVVLVGSGSDSIIFDFFAGSGTTGDATINLNRDNEASKRKYILCELGQYFNTVTKPRIQKVIYSKDWKDGKPVSREGSSHCFKYLRLEQYEDTLNNLYREPKDGNGWFEEKLEADTIGYVMDMQSQQNWMHTDWMANPFDVKMQITRGNEKAEQTIDVVETFNYLIGLNVEKMQWPEVGMQVVMGVTRKGKRTMVIWRNTTQITDEQVKEYLDSVDCKSLKQIYINGETTLGTILDGKLRQTESEFEYRMFAQDKA